eukprot:41671-Eustigmatos_ZCMA.PRE.1
MRRNPVIRLILGAGADARIGCHDVGSTGRKRMMLMVWWRPGGCMTTMRNKDHVDETLELIVPMAMIMRTPTSNRQ